MPIRAICLFLTLPLWNCTSIDAVTVQTRDISADGEAIAVVQATSVGFNLFFNFLPIVDSDLDTVVNRMLVAEAKAMGGSKVQITNAFATPRRGVFRVLTPLPVGIVNFVPFPNIISFPVSTATGVVLR